MIYSFFLICVSSLFWVTDEFDAEKCNAPTNVVGPDCFAAVTRYTYNKDKKACESFTFGGCEPSPNNFMTLEECQSTCM